MTIILKFLYFIIRQFHSFAVLLGYLLAELLYIVGIRKKIIDKNLKIAFPNMTENWYRYITRNVYRNFIRSSIMSVHYNYFPEKIRISEIEGLDEYKKALEEKKQIFYFTAHLGIWEIFPVFIRKNFRTAIVLYQNIKDKGMNDLILKSRQKSGVVFIERRNMPEIFRFLKRGYDIGMLVDQRPIEEGYPVEFFGKMTRFYLIPFKMMEKFNGIPVFIFAFSEDNGIKIKFIISKKTTVEDVLKDYVNNLENAIKEYPDQYFWFHNRWKNE